jgi:hypothetical protein
MGSKTLHKTGEGLKLQKTGGTHAGTRVDISGYKDHVSRLDDKMKLIENQIDNFV